MALTEIRSGCRGCPSGTAGAFPSQCQPCSNASVCPGFLQLPLPLDAASLGLPLGAPRPPPASLQASNPATAVSLFSAPLPSLPTPFSFFAGSSLLTGVAGLALCLLALAAVAVDVLRGGTHTGAALRRMDAFALDHAVLVEGKGPVRRATVLGGGCSLVMALMFTTFAALLFLRRYTDNVLTTNSIVVLSGITSNIAALPWAAPRAQRARPGVRLNIFSLAGLASARGDCATPLSWSAAGLSQGQWAVASASDGAPGTPSARSFLSFSCVDCAFTATSQLAFSLPFTCQALYMEATAVDPLGVVRALPLSPAFSSATATQLLTSVQWQLEVMLAVLLDQQDNAEGGGNSARGYQLLSSTGSCSTQFPGSSLLPSTSAVRVAVTLSLQPTFTLTQLSQKTSLADLGASVIGLAGLISFFRLLFQNSELLLERVAGGRCCGRAPMPAAGPPPAAAEAPPADALPWTRWVDGGDVWFVQEGTGATSWELPEGALLTSPLSTKRNKRHKGTSAQPEAVLAAS